MFQSLCRLRTVLLVAMLLFVGIGSWQQRCEAQQSEDVVYLKDGSVIRGTIIEQVPGQSILIQTRDGNRFRYAVDLIDRITKEASSTASVQRKKNPGTAGVLSALIVGAGQGYNGEWGKAALFFGGAVVFGSAAISAANSDKCLYNDECGEAAGYALAWVGLAVWSVVDAVASAKKINQAQVSVGPVRLAPSLAYDVPAPLTGGPSARGMRLRIARAEF